MAHSIRKPSQIRPKGKAGETSSEAAKRRKKAFQSFSKSKPKKKTTNPLLKFFRSF